jgi:hypothetical protein
MLACCLHQAANPDSGVAITNTFIPEHIDLEAKGRAISRANRRAPANGPAAVRQPMTPRMGLEAEAAPNLLVN